MVDDGCPAKQYTDTDKSPTEYVDPAAFGDVAAFERSTGRVLSDQHYSRPEDRGADRGRRLDRRAGVPAVPEQRKRERPHADTRDPRRPRRVTASPAAPAAGGPLSRAPRLPADAPAPDGDPKAIQAFIKAHGVCFNHARGLQCKHMVQNHYCRYLHTEEPIPFQAYPRLAPAPSLSAVGNHDENVLHAVDACAA